MKTVNVELTEEQLQIVMRALSYHLADLVDDEGTLQPLPFTRGDASGYFSDVSALYFKTFNPLQPEF